MTRTAFTLFASALALASPGAAQEPFAQGMRWSYDATQNLPWIPDSVSFSTRENLALVGSAGQTPHLAVLDRAAFGAHVPRFQDSTFVAAASHLTTVAGWSEDQFTAIQVPTPTKTSRATFVARHDGVAAAQGAAYAPTWIHDAGFLTNGPARLAAGADGDTVVLAVWDNLNSRVQLDWLDGDTGALVNRVLVSGAALNSLEMSRDGSTVAVAAGLDLYLFDGTGAQLHHEQLAAATKAVSLSDDGSTLAVGGIGQLAVFTEQPGGTWDNTFNVLAPKNELAAAADLSADGATLGLAWWDYAGGVDVRFEIWDLATLVKRTSMTQTGKLGGKQNLPQVVEVTRDGKLVAFGTWGDGWAAPEVLVFRTGEDQPEFVVDTPGSVRDLDLSESGSRLLVAYKATHNNVFSNQGGVLLFESGSQLISQLVPAETGEDLSVATHLARAGVSFLLIGERAAPTTIAGVGGTLLLDRSTLLVLVAPTQGGRADFALPVPDDPSLIGTQLTMQPAWRAFGGTLLGPELIDPLIVE